MRSAPALALALGLAAGCTADAAQLEPTTESVHEHILRPTCAVRGCHAPPSPQQGLDFSNVDKTLETAVDQPPTVGSAPMLYEAIIVPGDPEGSFLMAKITRPGADEGVAMPPDEWMLTDEAVGTVREWIASMSAEGGR